jgi:hypothetical protein
MRSPPKASKSRSDRTSSDQGVQPFPESFTSENGTMSAFMMSTQFMQRVVTAILQNTDELAVI